MAKSDDLVKYITQRVTQGVVTYFDTPSEIRKQKKIEKKTKVREPWTVRWFGLIPAALQLWVRKKDKHTFGSKD